MYGPAFMSAWSSEYSHEGQDVLAYGNLLILYRVVQHLIGATLFQQVTEDWKGNDVKEGHR